MPSIRDHFVQTFGEDQAIAFEAAAEEHENGLHPNKGSDPFQWTLMLVLSYECASQPEFAKYHGITASWPLVQAWIKLHGNMREYGGDVDLIAVLTNTYEPYMGETVQ